MLRSEWSLCFKKDFFGLLDNGIVPKNPVTFHLKYIQDCFSLAELKNACAKKLDHQASIFVGEIGADHSRVLPELKEYTKHLYAIDVYDRSIGGGRIDKPQAVDYEIIECLIGESNGLIENNFFDILFSVSVVENVPASMLFDFLVDHDRILRPGGVAIHLVDFYCNENKSPTGAPSYLIKCFRELDNSFRCPIDDWSFQPGFCSNDDYTMWQWNKIAPSLRPIRETCQSSTFILKIHKY
jgi:hypothetical protein